jgi:predicted transcriptional regulator
MLRKDQNMTEETLLPVDNEELMRMTTDIVASFLSHNSVPAENVPEMIKSVHATMKEISGEPAKPEPKAKPAVPISVRSPTITSSAWKTARS